MPYKKKEYCMCMPGASAKMYDQYGEVICIECEKPITKERLWQNIIDMWIKPKGDNG